MTVEEGNPQRWPSRLNWCKRFAKLRDSRGVKRFRDRYGSLGVEGPLLKDKEISPEGLSAFLKEARKMQEIFKLYEKAQGPWLVKKVLGQANAPKGNLLAWTYDHEADEVLSIWDQDLTAGALPLIREARALGEPLAVGIAYVPDGPDVPLFLVLKDAVRTELHNLHNTPADPRTPGGGCLLALWVTLARRLEIGGWPHVCPFCQIGDRVGRLFYSRRPITQTCGDCCRQRLQSHRKKIRKAKPANISLTSAPC